MIKVYSSSSFDAPLHVFKKLGTVVQLLPHALPYNEILKISRLKFEIMNLKIMNLKI
jgi:hypothetical protein